MAGLWTMIRLILRRDRVKLPLWIGGIVASLVAMVPLLRDVYGDEESLATMYATFGANPAGLFMTGPMDAPTFAAFFTLETVLWWGIAIAFFNTLLVVRHTRHNEDIGAQELLLSGRMRRATSLVAVLVVAFSANMLMTLLLGFGLELTDPVWSTEQSWLYAAVMGILGFVWASVAAVVVQLVESGRSANGILAGLIGAGFVVRGVGDFLGTTGTDGLHVAHWVSSLSPFGWAQAARPLIDPDWVALLPSILCSVVAISLGFILLACRDVGAGLLPSRQGKQHTARLLASPLGVTLYLQRGVYIGWLIAVLVMVATIGALTPQMSEVFDSSDSIKQMIEAIGGQGAMTASFLSAMMAITCLMVFAYVIQGVGRLRSEESSGHLESLQATKLSRLKWISLHIAVVTLGGISMLMATGLVLALCVNGLSDLTVDVWQYMLAGLSYAPVMLLFIAFYVVLFGIMPRAASGLSWLYFGFVAFSLWLGPIVQLDQWVMNLLVMEHVASPPSEEILWKPLLAISATAAILLVVGIAAWRRRDTVSS